jgi:hypothetical protein
VRGGRLSVLLLRLMGLCLRHLGPGVGSAEIECGKARPHLPTSSSFSSSFRCHWHWQGVSAHALDLTLPHPMTGCYGHPSAADHVEIAAKARPQIAAVMGWK